jgi:hypothetical protein
MPIRRRRKPLKFSKKQEGIPGRETLPGSAFSEGKLERS